MQLQNVGIRLIRHPQRLPHTLNSGSGHCVAHHRFDGGSHGEVSPAEGFEAGDGTEGLLHAGDVRLGGDHPVRGPEVHPRGLVDHDLLGLEREFCPTGGVGLELALRDDLVEALIAAISEVHERTATSKEGHLVEGVVTPRVPLVERHRHLPVVPPTLEVAVGQDVDLHVDADLAEVVLNQHRCLLVLSLGLLDPQLDRERLHAGLFKHLSGFVQVKAVHPGGFALIGLHRRGDQSAGRLGVAVLNVL